jgi:hypothetical protein
MRWLPASAATVYSKAGEITQQIIQRTGNGHAIEFGGLKLAVVILQRTLDR